MRNNYILVAGKKDSPKAFIQSWQFKVNKKEEEMDVPTFMSITSDETGISNLDTIWANYDDLEKEQYKDKYSQKDLPYIKAGTVLSFPIKTSPLLVEEVERSKEFLKQQDFQSYWSENLSKIISDPTFIRDNVVAYDEELSVKTKVQPLNIRIWIYCKAIDSIVDVSQYVISCNTNKTFQNGSFTVSLSPFRDYKNNQRFGASYYDNFNTVTKEGYHVKSYLEKIIQVNDIIFIRFERLKAEKNRDTSFEDREDIFVPENKLANTATSSNVWDMIGFIDGADESYSAEDNSRSTDIYGRDITKVFVEDGSYFIPLVNVEGSKNHWTYLGNPSDKFMQRNFITGNYNYLWSYKFKSVAEATWFVINIMSNIGLCKNDLFKSWQNKRITSYSVEGQNPLSVNGIWQIVKAYVSPEVEKRVLIDSSLGNPNGTLMDYMNRICQYPFVEFFFDTYINTIDLIIRQPPFNEAAILGTYKKGEYITITPDNVISYNLTYDSRIYSWFQLHVQNNNLVGAREHTLLAFVPIIYLEPYVELWGNRKMEMNDIYVQMKTTDGLESESQFVTMQAALLNDLIFLVETNAYLPFTRIGTIEINGDRRIKAGTFIKNEATDEFFYVLNVSNSIVFSENGMDRRTILQVERGMYCPILDGTSAKSVKRLDNSYVTVAGKPSYFNIVDLTELKQAAKQAEKGTLTTVSSPPVNKDQFEYFLQRKMFGGLV